MSDRLFEVDEEYPEVPILRPPVRRRSEGDARFRGEYPPEWKTCQSCGGAGFRASWSGEQSEGAILSTGGASAGMWETRTTCPSCLGMGSLKARVRLEAGHRCLRCQHPYMPKGDAKMLGLEPSWRPDGWSACDLRCDHLGPKRVVDVDGVLKFSNPTPGRAWHRHILIGDSGRRVESEWRVLTVHHADGDKGNVPGGTCSRSASGATLRCRRRSSWSASSRTRTRPGSGRSSPATTLGSTWARS